MRLTSAELPRLLLIAGLLASPACDPDEGAETVPAAEMDEAAVRQKTQERLRRLDSAEFAAKVRDDEFLVKAFMLIDGRAPDALEFHVLRGVAQEGNLDRSDILTMMLADKKGDIDEKVARELLAQGIYEALEESPQVRALAESLKRTPLRDALALHPEKASIGVRDKSSRPNPAAVADETYNTYFGFLHSHTSYSDGEGTPDQAYRHARDQGGMDFFAVTDHSELLSTWWWNNEWAKLRSAANAHNQSGSYVTLWGFEYSNPLLGHALVLNTNDFTSAFTSLVLGDLYSWIKSRPAGFGGFNHPGDYDDLGVEFYHLSVVDEGVIPQMVGIELWNGSDGFDRYYYENTWSGSDVSYLDVGNLNGWFLGALGAQDNHVPDWGTKNQFRTGVLAKGLTRADLIEAYRARRFYATEDKDLVLDVRCAGFPMGSRLTGVPRQFTVSAHDRGGDGFSELRIYRDGVLIDVSAVAGSDVSTTFTDSASGGHYYYVIVRQTDDNDGNGRNDEAISSPIWID